ncbi:hypothetical protein ABS71_04785 [bacterium SCN 62-11]|nr:hypothetical protein [Candidatus Eremiobacteraeota bacterium]ODT75133.1 MAG: hypothetical protein ABS71_04785 [bacterium SCN 62-11]
MKTMLISVLALTGFAFAEPAPSAGQLALQVAQTVQASAPDCCQPGADCCKPGADCCAEKSDAKAEDCCAPGAACCVPGAACCD